MLRNLQTKNVLTRHRGLAHLACPAHPIDRGALENTQNPAGLAGLTRTQRRMTTDLDPATESHALAGAETLETSLALAMSWANALAPDLACALSAELHSMTDLAEHKATALAVWCSSRR
mmetsp:Transcript_51092/g.136307  ORF Transcript_51092/g.136307 Transcript_51092/m.136307 type:complete len:119 (+) Transcript_51092:718-1074(+)